MTEPEVVLYLICSSRFVLEVAGSGIGLPKVNGGCNAWFIPSLVALRISWTSPLDLIYKCIYTMIYSSAARWPTASGEGRDYLDLGLGIKNDGDTCIVSLLCGL